MERKCELFPVREVLKSNPGLLNSPVQVYYDWDFREEMYNFLSKGKRMNNMQVRLHCMLRGINSYHKDFYGKYDISDKAKYITAIKFKKGDNWRILCKEFFLNGKKEYSVDKINKKTFAEYYKKNEKSNKIDRRL